MKVLPYLTFLLFVSSSGFSQTISGSGSQNYVPRFTGTSPTSILGNSIIYDNGSNVGIGNTSPSYKLDVNGMGNFSADLLVNGLTLGKGGGNVNTNTVFGIGAGSTSTTATGNVFMGYQSGILNTIGSGNTFTGIWSGSSNISGNNNVFVGNSAGNHNTTGYQNTILGQGTGYNNSTGNSNSFFGNATAFENTTGSNNAYFGYNSGRNITTGSNNTIIGSNITGLASNLSNNIIIADGAGNRRINVDATGNVGIGTLSPGTKVHILGGDLSVVGSDQNGTALITSHGSIAYYGNNTYNNGIAVMPSGNVTIGTSTDNPAYKFAVNGSAIFTKAVVRPYPWADYVFDSSYSLIPLREVEAYIASNKHLPGIPGATEVDKNGIDIGENQTLLLKKVEELTLYLIDLNKDVLLLKKEVKNLSNENELLKKEISDSSHK